MNGGRDSAILGAIFERQWLHGLALAILLAALVLAQRISAFTAGELWGIATPAWLWIAVVLAIAHQVLVWLCWRTELHARLLTRMLGRHAFDTYAAMFAALGLARVLAVFALAIANRDTVPGDRTALAIAAVLALLPALYLFYSVRRYFSFRRAFGIDHFDARYRTMPFVRQGIFRITPNGMYVFGFLLLWVPGLWWASAAALGAALFNHLYIWVHYYATERPDIARIYGPGA